MKAAKFVQLATSLSLVTWLGCNAIIDLESGEEDICAWISSGDNCYREFHKIAGIRCGFSDFSQAQGSFDSRASLDVCKTTNAQIVFDPPLNVAKLSSGDPDATPVTITFVRNDGSTCGSVRLFDKHSFSVSMFFPQAGYSSDSSQDSNSTFAATREMSDILPSAPLNITCPDGDVHGFRLDRLDDCPALAQVLPAAIFEVDPGGGQKDGFARLKILYPPVRIGSSMSEQNVLSPEAVFYFDCLIP